MERWLFWLQMLFIIGTCLQGILTILMPEITVFIIVHESRIMYQFGLTREGMILSGISSFFLAYVETLLLIKAETGEDSSSTL